MTEMNDSDFMSMNPPAAPEMSDSDFMNMGQPKPSVASDVGKTLAGNVAPNAAANFTSNVLSPAYTAGSYGLQLGLKGGEYLGEGVDELHRLATGQPQATQADYDSQQRDLMNAIRGKMGMSPTDNGDISNLVPTPSNLVSGAANLIGHPLYQPKTEAGKNVEAIGDVATTGLGSGMNGPTALLGAVGSDLAGQAAKHAGAPDAVQFLANLAGGIGGAKAGKALPEQTDMAPINPPNSPSPIRPHDPLQAATDLSSTIFDNISRANKYYSLPNEIANGQSAYAPQVGNYLQGVISDIQSDPFHEARPLLGKLQNTLDSLPDDDNVSVSTLLDLRKASNANFKPGRMNDKDGVYAGLNSAVNAGLDDARQNIPHFSDALDVADNYWKNSVSQPITKNSVLQKVFDMEDAHNMRQFNVGQIDDVPDVTKQSANNLVAKTKDVDTYNAIRRLLPPDTGQSYDAALLNKIIPTQWGEIFSAAKSAGNLKFGDTVQHVINAVKPDLTPQQTQLVSAIKKQNTYYPIGVRNEAADNAYNSVKGAYEESQKPVGYLAPPTKEPVISPTINVPAGGFGSDEVQVPSGEGPLQWDEKGRPYRVALPPPKEMSYADMVKAGRILPNAPRPDFMGTTEGQVSAVPNAQIGPYQFGQNEGMPFQPGELENERVQAGNYQNMPINSMRGQRAFNNSLQNRADSLGLMTSGISPEQAYGEIGTHEIHEDHSTDLHGKYKDGDFQKYGAQNADDGTTSSTRKTTPDEGDEDNERSGSGSRNTGGRAQSGNLGKRLYRYALPSSKQNSFAAGGQVNLNPSDAQKEYGNYKKLHRRIYGLDITIENPKGSERSGIDKNGRKWACTLPADYGYFKGTLAADGDHVDCYVGPKLGSSKAYVIDQLDKDTDKYDEAKVMLGYMNLEDALHDYCKAFSDNKGHDRIGAVTTMTIDQFKKWLKHENTENPVGRIA